MEDDPMKTKFLAVIGILLGLLVSTNETSAAKWSRGECVDAVRQKLGIGAADTGHTTNKAAVRRCMKHGPNAID